MLRKHQLNTAHCFFCLAVSFTESSTSWYWLCRETTPSHLNHPVAWQHGIHLMTQCWRNNGYCNRGEVLTRALSSTHTDSRPGNVRHSICLLADWQCCPTVSLSASLPILSGYLPWDWRGIPPPHQLLCFERENTPAGFRQTQREKHSDIKLNIL